jgi:hypothetical protein
MMGSAIGKGKPARLEPEEGPAHLEALRSEQGSAWRRTHRWRYGSSGRRLVSGRTWLEVDWM